MSPTKLMQPVHLRGFRGVLGGTQGSLVCEIMEPREGPGQCVFLVRVVLCFLFFFPFWPPKWSWPRSHIPLSVNPSLFSTQWVTPGGLYPQFLHASANTCTHIHAHIPGPMPISHALPRLNTARGSPLCPSSYSFPAQEGISSQKHPETARVNTPPTHTHTHFCHSKSSVSLQPFLTVYRFLRCLLICQVLATLDSSGKSGLGSREGT